MSSWVCFFLLQLLGGIWPKPWAMALILPLSWFVILVAKDGRRLWRALALLVALITPLLQYLQRPVRFQSPTPQQLAQLGTQLEPETFAQQTKQMESALADPMSKMGDDVFSQILDPLQLPSWLSVSLLNLNFEPLAWKGSFFCDQYNLPDEQPRLIVRDGRLFAVRLAVLPSRQHAVGYLAIESLLASAHADERDLSWMAAIAPGNKRFKPEIADLGKGELVHFAQGLGAPLENFEIHFVEEARPQRGLDLIATVWALFLFGLLIYLGGHLPQRSFFLFAAALAGILFFPFQPVHPKLSLFAPYLFSGPLMAIRSPLHLFLFSALIWILTLRLLRSFRECPYLKALIPFLLGLQSLFLAGFLQDQAGFSLVHPLLAFESVGHFLTFAAVLLAISLPLHLVELKQDSRILTKTNILILISALAATLLLQPTAFIGFVSLLLLWLLGARRLPLSLRIALVLLSFYPFLVQREQLRERLIARDEILDEITLLEERSYFRMNRVLQSVDSLTKRIEQGQHPHLMLLFAQDCGLFLEDVDFALRLTSQDGKVVSDIDQHVALDHLPYALGPQNQMERFHDSSTGSAWLIYRTSIGTTRGVYELVAVIGDDYHSLSLLRSLQRFKFDESGGLGIYPMPPHNSFQLDIFNRNGEAIYFQDKPNPITSQNREILERQPFTWFVRGRDTVFLFSNQDYIYRVTHMATPLKMLIARGFAFFLALFFFIRVLRFLLNPGRGPIEWIRRSFALKMAGFIFLAGFLPTLTLGIYLLRSGQVTQEREEVALARSKIMAASHLLRPNAISELDWSNANQDFHNLPLLDFANHFGDDLSLFYSGSLIRTSQPEAFRQGLLQRRVPYAIAVDLVRRQASYRLERNIHEGSSLLTAYSALETNQPAIVGMTMIPFNQSQSLRWRERLEFGVIVWLGILFGLAWLARGLAKSVLSPVAALTRAASRMAKGLTYQPITLQRHDELQRMVNAFNTMRERVETSQARLSEQLEIQDETLRSMSGGLIGFDNQGKIRLRNRKAWALLGFTRRPKNLPALIKLEPELAELGRMLREGIGGEIRFKPSHCDERVELLAKFRIVESGRIQDLRGILALEDITGALASNRLEAWSEMARRVAHEIKNPLTPIQLEIEHIQRLHQDKHPDFDAALAEAVVEIKRQVNHLRQTATEFSDYARPVALCTERFDLVELLEEMMAPYQKTLSQISLKLQLPESAFCSGDPRLLRRSFHNLIINAVQAMNGKGVLTLRLREDATHWIAEIEDTGPGIPLEMRHRVFEAYFSTKDQGTGLGLVIAQKYVMLHGGIIEIEDGSGTGTRFVIRLPKNE